jgi:hypothetical protein
MTRSQKYQQAFIYAVTVLGLLVLAGVALGQGSF